MNAGTKLAGALWVALVGGECDGGDGRDRVVSHGAPAAAPADWGYSGDSRVW